MTSSWASYLVALAIALAAAVALMGAVVVLLVGRVAELHCRVAAPGRRPGPLRGATGAGITVGGVWRGLSER